MDSACPQCGGSLESRTVMTAIWRDTELAIVRDIPAIVCGRCGEQFYDDQTSEALRRLAEDGFPPDQARTHIHVPVFSLTDRLTTRVPLPEDTFLD